VNVTLPGTRSETATEDVLSLSYTWSSHKRERQNTLLVVFSNAPQRVGGFVHRSDRGGARWLYIGVVTSDLIHRENARRFLTSHVWAGCLLTVLEAACSGKSGGVRQRSARAKAASHPVSRQPAQTSGVRKRVPFSTGVVLHRYRVTLGRRLCWPVRHNRLCVWR